jgi:hypothetical protein
MVKKLRRGALFIVAFPLVLVFFNRPSRGEIVVLGPVIFVFLFFGFSSWFTKHSLSIAERMGRVVALLISCTLALGTYAWHFWPEPPAATLVPCPDDAGIVVCNSGGTIVKGNTEIGLSTNFTSVNNSPNSEIKSNTFQAVPTQYRSIYKAGFDLADDCEHWKMHHDYWYVKSDAELKSKIAKWENAVPSVLAGGNLEHWSKRFGTRRDDGRRELSQYCSEVGHNSDRTEFLRSLTD